MSRTTGEWSERFYAHLMREINQERAAAHGRVGRELERAWTRADALSRQIDGDEDADPEAIEEYRQAYRDVERWRWKLCVQRECNGLFDHRWVDLVYPPLRRP